MNEFDSGQRHDTMSQRVVQDMITKDALSELFNMVVTAVGEGYAVVEMKVDERMLNGFGLCHGGVIAALSDSAFGFACNSRNELTVASSIAIEFLNSAAKDDLLVATANEVSLKSRLGLYQVKVVNQKSEVVALMTGRSYKLEGRYVVQDDHQGGL